MNQHVKAYATAAGTLSTAKPVTNYQGGRGYELSLAERVTSFAHLGLIGNTYFEKEEFQINNSKAMLSEAIRTMPDHVMREAIAGRKQYQMKFAPILMLVYLSTLEDSRYFTEAFGQVILTAKDMHTFLDLARKGGIRKGLSRKVRNAMNNLLLSRMNEKMATRNKGILKDVISCTRPKPHAPQATKLFNDAMTYIMRGELTLPRAVALKRVLDGLSEGVLTEEMLQLIEKFRLENEELKSGIGFLGREDRQRLYEQFIPNYGYAGLSSNLVNIARTFDGNVPESVVRMVAAMLSDSDAYQRSKMLPFGLINAHEMTQVPEWKSALDFMIKTAVPSSFNVTERVMAVVDVSGSMRTEYVNEKRTLAASRVASIFGSVFYLSNPEMVDLHAVGTYCRPVVANAKDVFSLATQIENSMGGGTHFERIMDHYKGQKYLLLITDSEQADNLEHLWRKAHRPEGAKIIVWQTAGTPHKISDRPDTIYLFGYSLGMLEIIKRIIEQ